jgi:hypothetical protein
MNRIIGKRCLTLLSLLAVVLLAPSAWAAIYYVSPTGNNSTGNGSQSAPWQSLSSACSKVSAGNTIYVNAGTYTDNNTCSLATGVMIQGAGSSSVIINTSASPYINAVSSLPVVDGSNEISGISFIGSGSNTGIFSAARSNQKIHDCKFNNFGNAIDVHGKVPAWSSSCASAPPSQSASYCDDYEDLSIEPASTDWATGVEIYNNNLTNAKIHPQTVKGATIHGNVIDNSTSLKSAVGNTALWWNGVQFYNNTIKMQTIAWSTIAIEVWMVEGDTKFYNNWTNGWFSILKNPKGPSTPYSWEIVNNTFESNVPQGLGSGAVGQALETCYFANNVLIAGNYFTNTGTNKTYDMAIGIHGKGPNQNFMIRNNVIYNMGHDGIEIDTNDASGRVFAGQNINIYNNVFDTLNNGSSQGVYINATSPGTLVGMNIKNNIFTKVAHGALTSGSQVSGINFQYNDIYGAAGNTSGSGFSSTANNINVIPNIQATGTRPTPYYRAQSSVANIIDKGTNVGLPYSGSVPDIGAYEYMLDLNSPTSLY